MIVDNFHLFREDCMDTMSRYPDKYFDLASCDPPYYKVVANCGFYGKNNSSIGVSRSDYEIPEWDDQIPDQAWLDEVVRVSKHQIIWGINYYQFLHCSGRIIWDKINGTSSFSDCEIASCTYHKHVKLFRYMWNGMIQGKSLSEPLTMQGNKKLNEKRIHGTQKPVNLYKWLFKTYGFTGMKVISTHMGSMSDAVAAFDYGVGEFVGAEINQKNFDRGHKRFTNHVSQLKLF